MLAQITTNIVTITNTVTDVGGAIATLVQSALPHLTGQEDLDVVGLIFLIARILRKAVPDELQTGKAGELLKHIALEINPVLGELKPVVTIAEPLVSEVIQTELQKTTPVVSQPIVTPAVIPSNPLL